MIKIPNCSVSKSIAIGIIIFFTAIISLFAQQTTERSEWFVDDRFGMFIHWGIYSGAEGYWQGEKLRYDNDYAEWIQYRNRIDKDDYLTLLDRFKWDEINVEDWVILAKKAGMKYITLTAKHHDGFALWKSDSNAYNIYNHSGKQRDIVKELAEACKKHGLKMGLYYSHWVDWEHPYGWDHTNEVYEISADQYNEYWQEKVIPQMRELLTNYGNIGLIWFDMWMHHSQTIVSKEQLFQLKSLIRELQPDCLINSRLGLSIEEDSDVDFRTMGDNQLGNKKLNYPWQTSGTVAHSWGFHATENQWKSTTSLLKALINNVSLNGNFMLNIGPRANGIVPYEIESRLLEIGTWLNVHGEAIYNCEGFDLRKDAHDWGKITRKDVGDKTLVYLHVFNWPLENTLKVTGIKNPPVNVYALSKNHRNSLNFEHKGVITNIALPKKAPDPRVSVLVMEYNNPPETQSNLVSEVMGGGFAFTIDNAISSSGENEVMKAARFGSIPKHVLIEENDIVNWQCYFDMPGVYEITISYSVQDKSPNGQVMITVGDSSLSESLIYTGLTVGEPKSDWVIERFESHKLGDIQVETEGLKSVAMKVDLRETNLKFNRIWIKKKR